AIFDGLHEGDEDWMIGLAMIRALEFVLPAVESRLALFDGLTAFVGKVVSGASEGIERRQIGPLFGRHEALRDLKILEVLARNALAIGECFVYRIRRLLRRERRPGARPSDQLDH